jgi:hypothetical protein
LLVLLLLLLLGNAHAQSGYLRNESNSNPLDSNAKKIIVLIHGWNPDDLTDSFAKDPWPSLITNVKQKIKDSDWQLFTFHWEQGALGADTGDIFYDHSIDGWNFTAPVGHAVTAANHALQQGHNLADSLQQACPGLRRVQLIAHSAGAWVARQAAEDILQKNSYVTVQVTLLDPFIPDVIPGQSSGLNDQLMVKLDEVTGNDRISLLENYYSTDVETFSPTWQTFSWRLADINTRISWDDIINFYYASHSGPIQFYADTVYQSLGNSTPTGLYGLLCPFDFSQVGWLKSLFYTDQVRSPGIALQPQNQSAETGSTINLAVTASSSHPLSYQWFLKGQPVPTATAATYSFTLSQLTVGDYVVKISYSDRIGFVFSDSASVTLASPTAPIITSVSPGSLITSSTAQPFQVFGSGFTTSSTLLFNEWSGSLRRLGEA